MHWTGTFMGRRSRMTSSIPSGSEIGQAFPFRDASFEESMQRYCILLPKEAPSPYRPEQQQ